MEDVTSCTDANTQTDTESQAELSVSDENVEPDTTHTTADSSTQSTPGQPWYKAPKYRRYWAQHGKVAQWFHHVDQQKKADQCRDYYREMAEYHSSMAHWTRQMESYYTNWYTTWLRYQNQQSQVLCQPTTTKTPNHTTKNNVNPQVTQKRKGTKIKSKNKRRKKRNSISGPSTVKVVPPGEQFEMEITDGMIDFFVQSAKHRKERDASKKQKEEETLPKDEHIDLTEANAGKNKASELPPSDRPGAKRTVEMKLLYGKGAAMIHGMETAMQLNYDRNCDRQQPKMWPQLPLNIKFS